MITDFTLFNVSIIDPTTREIIDQGEMQARNAKAFVEKMDAQGIPVLVKNKQGDALEFTEYMFNSKIVSSIVPSKNN